MKIKKIRFIAAVALAFSFMNSVNAEDVKVESNNTRLAVGNGQVKVEVSRSGDIKISGARENKAMVTVSLYGSDGKTEIKASRWNMEKDTPGEAIINLYSGKPEFLAAAFTVKKDSDYLILDPGYKTHEALIKLKSNIAVMPDMLAENYLYYPEKVKSDCLIPYDSYCLLNLMNEGAAMFALMWNSDETRVFLGKDSAENKNFDYNKIKLGRHKTLYLGLITSPDIWYVIKDRLDKKEFTKINWRPPFQAEWLMTTEVEKGVVPLSDGSYDAWIIPKRTDEMKGSVSIKADIGIGIKDAATWTVWSYLLNAYIYPCYLKDNSLYAKVPASPVERLSYNADYNPLIYAWRCNTSAKDGRVLPCEYLKNVLDADRYQRLDFIRNLESHYPGTCGTIDTVWRIFKDEAFKEKRDFLLKCLDMMNKFVNVTDKRVNEYKDWALKEIEELNRISSQKPELKKTADVLIGYLRDIDAEIDGLKEKIRTPEPSAQAVEKIIELIDKDMSPEAKEEECNKLGREIRLMAHHRDRLCAVLRLCVKSIRSRIAGILSEGATYDEAGLLMKIRTDCGDILRCRYPLEGK